MAERTTFPVEVLTPEGEVFNDEVVQISTKTTVGSIGILAKHQPLLAMLDPTELRLYRSDGDVVRYAQGEGYVQVQNDSRVLILVDEAADPSSLDEGEWREKLRRAEDELTRCETGSQQEDAVKREKRRAEAFLEIIRGGAEA
ncbi:MAG TPA: ATP synthase F1 subunit epsilon [Solirubrobacteraceae bacterium]|nr:ATP synthase F1 subunit epsilon [Solirubrobacteraceae bacterium]